MNRRKSSKGSADRASTPQLLCHMWWLRRAMACPCSGQQIRRHLFMADLLAWLLIVVALAFIFIKFR